MSEVQRYAIKDGWLVAEENGKVVSYEAYAALQQKLDAVLAENVALKGFIKAECSICNDDGFDIDAEQAMPETPATDAILNAVRSEGVEMFADSAYCSRDQYLWVMHFANQLRDCNTEGGA